MSKLSVIVAVAKNGVIGFQGTMPWHLPADLAHFKQVTQGHTVIMGRKTFESIGRPLPNRRNIVVTRQSALAGNEPELASSLSTALELCHYSSGDNEVFVIGGASLYAEALQIADCLYLTEVDAELQGDTWFPAFDRSEWREISRLHRGPDAKNRYSLDFVKLQRIRATA